MSLALGEIEDHDADPLPFSKIQNYMVRVLNKVEAVGFIEMASCSRAVKDFLEVNRANILVRGSEELSILSGIDKFQNSAILFMNTGWVYDICDSSLIGSMRFDRITIDVREDMKDALEASWKNRKFVCKQLTLSKGSSTPSFLELAVNKIDFKILKMSFITAEALTKVPSTCSHLIADQLETLPPFSLLSRFESFVITHQHGSLQRGHDQRGVFPIYAREFLEGDRGSLKKIVWTMYVEVENKPIPGFVLIYHGEMLHYGVLTLAVKQLENNQLMAVTKIDYKQTWELIGDDRRTLIDYLLNNMNNPVSGIHPSLRYSLYINQTSLSDLIPKLLPLPLEDYNAAIKTFIYEQKELCKVREEEKKNSRSVAGPMTRSQRIRREKSPLQSL